MTVGPACPLSVPLVAALCGLALGLGPGSLSAAPPTTAPDSSPPAALSARHLATLKAMCRQLHQRQWGEPIVETFDDPPRANPWRAEGGSVQVQEGRLVFTLQGEARRLVVLSRTAPPELRGADGVRIDIWLEGEPVEWQIGNPPAARKQTMFTLALFLDSRNAAQMQWEYSYFLAVGADGSTHYFRSMHHTTVQTARTTPLAPGQPVHARMELVGPEVRCRRDPAGPLTVRLANAPPLNIGDNTRIGLGGYFKQLRVSRVVYRRLDAETHPPELAELWPRTPFPDAEAFTRYLLEHVIPDLDAPSYQARLRTERLLTDLWPLSRAAVEQAARRPAGLKDEARMRLANLRGFAPTLKVVTTQPDDDDFAPPPPRPARPAPTTQPAATTQPDAPSRPEPAPDAAHGLTR